MNLETNINKKAIKVLEKKYLETGRLTKKEARAILNRYFRIDKNLSRIIFEGLSKKGDIEIKQGIIFLKSGKHSFQ